RRPGFGRRTSIGGGPRLEGTVHGSQDRFAGPLVSRSAGFVGRGHLRGPGGVVGRGRPPGVVWPDPSALQGFNEHSRRTATDESPGGQLLRTAGSEVVQAWARSATARAAVRAASKPGGPMPIATAAMAAWVRLVTPSFLKTAARWAFTVFSDRKSCREISRLLAPPDRSWSTSFSRRVSPAS